MQIKKSFIFLTLFAINSLLCTIAFAEEPKPVPQYSLAILSPAPEETFQNDAQSITVTLSISPELAPNDTVVIYVDGSPAGEPVHETSVALPYLERGPHTLQAKIIQPGGNGAETDPITIYQQRVSSRLPAH